MFSRFVERTILASTAVTPPVVTTLPITITALAKHAGHIQPPVAQALLLALSIEGLVLLQFWPPCFRRFADATEHVLPAADYVFAMLFRNHAQRQVLKFDERSAFLFA